MVDSAFSPEVIPLWPDVAPGSEHWSQQEQETYLPQCLSTGSCRQKRVMKTSSGNCRNASHIS
jgi:hypothetical protein